MPRLTKEEVALRPFADPEILNLLATDEYYLVRYRVSQHPNTSTKTLVQLLGDPISLVRSVAEHRLRKHNNRPSETTNPQPSSPQNLVAPTDTSVLDALSQDLRGEIREQVALNPNTPPTTLERLTRDPNPWCRAALARNPATPTATLAVLCEEESERFIRLFLAERTDIPVRYLRAWAQQFTEKNDSITFLALCHRWLEIPSF